MSRFHRRSKKKQQANFLKNGGRYANPDGTRAPIPIFTPKERDEIHAGGAGFKKAVVDRWLKRTQRIHPHDIVAECRRYYKRRYDEQREKGVRRVSPWLNSTSTCLTHIKHYFRDNSLASYAYRSQIKLTKPELMRLDRLNHARLEENAQDLTEVDICQILKLGCKLLDSDRADELTIAVALFTGRRQAEVTHSMHMEPPLEPGRHRYPSFWAHCTGFLKQRRGDRFAVRARELPLLAPRDQIVIALERLRDLWPSDSHTQASKLYGSAVSRAVKKHLAPCGIKKLHDLRKFFAVVSHKHFNERNLSLPAYASWVLGHKRKVSTKILTYLSIHCTNDPGLQSIFHYHRCGLNEDRAEHQDTLGNVSPVVVTPINTDSEPESDSESESETKSKSKPKLPGPPRRLRSILEQHPPRPRHRPVAAAAAAGTRPSKRTVPASDPTAAAKAIGAAFRTQ